jgi:tRNA (guanine10-N2)-methyltransferase
MCLGCDIDYHTLEGKGEDKTILANFRQYKLTKPDIFRADQSRHPWKQLSRHLSGCDFQVDAIICDPPYGIRAGAKKIRSIPDQVILAGKPHHQQKEQYPIEEVTSDLLVFAAQHLVMNGRLVFLFPTTNEFKPSDLSSHPCLEVIANSEQVLQGVFRRRLVTMQKVRPFDPTFKVSHPDYEPAHHNLYEKYYGIAPSPNHEPRSKRQKQPAVANASEAASKEMTDA